MKDYTLRIDAVPGGYKVSLDLLTNIFPDILSAITWAVKQIEGDQNNG